MGRGGLEEDCGERDSAPVATVWPPDLVAQCAGPHFRFFLAARRSPSSGSMDELDALEALCAAPAPTASGVGNPSSGSGRGGAGPALDGDALVGDSLPPETPQPKRRKKDGLWSGAAKIERGGTIDDLGSIVRSEGSADDIACSDAGLGDGDEQRACYGCARVYGVSRCWFTGQPVQWGAAQGRGHWCRECQTCWRTCFSESHTMVFFAKWLRQPLSYGANFALWEAHLLAFLSLRKEGIARITQPQVEQRMRLLDFVNALQGMRARHSMVEVLSDVVAKGGGGQIEPGHLLTIREKGVDKLGMLVPAPFQSGSPSVVMRPPCSPMPLNDRAFLSTSSADDREALRTAFGTISEVAVVEAPRELEESPRFSRNQVRLDTMKIAAQQLISGFSGARWFEVKESQFTAPVRGLGEYHAEVLADGDSECELVALHWHSGLSAAKRFLKGHREYQKTHGKVEKLREITEALEEFYAFLLSQKVVPHCTFTLLWLKALFHKATAEQQTANSGLSAMIGLGLGLAMAATRLDASKAASSSSGAFSCDSWLRSIMQKAFIEVLQVADAKGLAEGLPQLALDLCKCQQLLRDDDYTKEECATIIEDISSLATILESAMEPCPVQPDSVAQALRHMELKRNIIFKAALVSCDFGRSVISAATTVMQISEKDSAGDESLDRALSILRDPRMPSISLLVREGGGEAIIQGFALIMDMSIADILHESLACAVEALNLWSPGRTCERDIKIREWTDAMMKFVLFVDESLCLYLQGLVASAGVEKLLFAPDPLADSGPADDSGSMSEPARPTMQGMGSELDARAIDEGAFETFVKALLEVFCNDRPTHKNTKSLFVGSGAKLQARVLQNIQTRSQVASLVCALAEFQGIPQSPDCALNEWRSKVAIGKEDSSFLANAIRLQRLACRVEPIAFGSLDGQRDFFLLEIDESDQSKSMASSIDKALNLVDNLLGSPLLTSISKLLQGVVQVAVDEFAESLHLSAISMPQPEVFAVPLHGKAILVALDSFFDKDSGAEALKVSQKVFSNKANKDMMWPCASLHTIVVDLLSVVPAKDCKISMESFVSPGVEAPTWGDKAMLRKLFAMCMPLSQVMSSLMYLQARLSGDEPLVREFLLKDEIETAFNVARTTTMRQLETLKAAQVPESIQAIKWRSPALVTSQVWFQAVSDFMPALATHIITNLIPSTRELAMAVRGFTPKTAHLASGEKFAVSLARKSLLNWPSRQQLNEKTKALFSNLAHLSRLHTQWCIAGSLKENELWKDDMDEAHGIFDDAKSAMTTIAAVNIIAELKGDEQKERAADMLQKQRLSLPKNIVAELERLAK